MRYDHVRRVVSEVNGWTLVAAGVVAVAIGAAVADYLVAVELLGSYPECRAGSCGDQAGWVDEAQRRSDEVAARTWAYAAAGSAAVAVATARALRRRPPTDRRTIFANLGSVGVLLGVLYAALLWFSQGTWVEVDMRPGWVFVGLLLGTAAAGGTLSRLTSSGAEVRFLHSGWRRYFDYAAIGAAVPTVATLILVLVFLDQQSQYSCSMPVPASEYDWNEYVWWGAFGTAVGAAGLALAGLLARHWFNAVTCLLVNFVLLAYTVISALC